MTQILQHQFENGLVLLAEPVPGAQSLSMTMLLPAGVVAEPADRLGLGSVMTEMVCRGAGNLDARAHSDALDLLGVQRDTGVQVRHFRLDATMIGSKLPQALPLLLDMVRRPMLKDESLSPSVDLAIQSIEALEDEPQQKVFYELRQRHHPEPFGRSPLGRQDHLEQLTINDVRRFWQEAFVPAGSVIGVAGKFDWNELLNLVGRQTSDWKGSRPEPVPTGKPVRGYHHEQADATQVHIGLAYDALPETHPDSILQRFAVAVLSGGMSGRLFTEVREKRGLCYSVFASYSGDQHRGTVLSYAGTTAPRAQETLDVLSNELRRIGDGVDQNEFERAKVGMKSRLVMQGESTGARAGAIAMDQVVYGKPRTLDELAARVDAVTLDAVNEFVAANKPGDMTLVTVGPEQLAFGTAAV